MIDGNGLEIVNPIQMVFVCDVCGNTADFYNGISTYAKTINGTVTNQSYCSEICVKKAVAA